MFLTLADAAKYTPGADADTLNRLPPREVS